MDLGGTKLVAGAIDAQHEVLHRTYRQVIGLDRDRLLAEIVDGVSEVRGLLGREGRQIGAVGFGVPSLIDRRSEQLAATVHLPLRGVPFAAEMRRRLQLPVAVDNDGNCGALAESRTGFGRKAEVLVFIGLGTGVASGVVLGGRLFRGAIGAAPELGHMVVDLDGYRCHGNCSSRGCLETIASGTALRREAVAVASEHPDGELGKRLRLGDELTGQLVTQLALSGNPEASAVIDMIGRGLGIGLANVVNIFNPDLIVVGGGVSAAGELLLAPARDVMLERALSPGREYVRVEQAQLGENASMIGAAMLAREEAE